MPKQTLGEPAAISGRHFPSKHPEWVNAHPCPETLPSTHHCPRTHCILHTAYTTCTHTSHTTHRPTTHLLTLHTHTPLTCSHTYHTDSCTVTLVGGRALGHMWCGGDVKRKVGLLGQGETHPVCLDKKPSPPSSPGLLFIRHIILQ